MNDAARDRRRALAFVAGSLVLVALVLAVMGGVRLTRHERIYYVVVTDSVSGLRAASTVEYKGVPVGIVRDVTFRQGSVEAVEVVLGIREGVAIKTDTRARLRAQGITGLNVLELVGGTAGAPDLPEGGDVPYVPSLLGELEAAVHDVAAVARRLDAATAAIVTDLAGAVADLRSALVASHDAARALEANAAVIGSEVTGSGAAVREILRDPAWRSLGAEVLAAVADVRDAVAALQRAAFQAESLAAENRSDVRAAVDNARRASRDVRSAAQRLRDSPADLLIEHPPAKKPIPDPLPPRGRH